MILLLDAVEHSIRHHHLLQPGDGVLVAVSGGADSLALLAVLRHFAGVWPLRLHVAHLNHLLRPGAGEDARFVETLAGAWGVPAAVEASDVRSYARAHQFSLEAAAREVRYAFLGRVAAERGCAAVAVGHTADDQAETLLLRLIRGGRPGGMWPRRPLGSAMLIRPLLDVWRRDLRAYLQQQGLTWREDPTNRDRTFLRNRIRHDLIPLLAGYIPDVQERLKQWADVLAAEDAAMEAAAAAVEPAVVGSAPRGVLVHRQPLLAHPPAVQWRLVRGAVAGAGGNIRRLKFVHITEALRLAEHGSPGQQLSLPGVVLEVQGGDLVFGPPRLDAPRRARPADEFVIPLGGRVEADPLGMIVESAVVPREAADFAEDAAYLDADRVGSPMTLRAWRAGDRFRPLGMQGKKKVGDFLTDAKAPPLGRSRIPVVEASDGTIVWLVGWRVAEDARLTPETRRVLRLKAFAKR